MADPKIQKQNAASQLNKEAEGDIPTQKKKTTILKRAGGWVHSRNDILEGTKGQSKKQKGRQKRKPNDLG